MTATSDWAEVVRPGLQFQEQDGILVSDKLLSIQGQNQKYQHFYDKFAWGYDLWEIVYAGLFCGGRDAARHDLLKNLAVKPGDRVLEVSIGTGVNLKYLPKAAQYYGLDLSWKMLRQCRRNVPRWDREVSLFHGIAEELPFRDGLFDVVFHIGGLNFFQDPRQAIREMLRVAKPGALISFGDETEKMVREVYEKTPLAGKYFQGEQVPSPLTWVPEGIQPRYEAILKGKFYIVDFRKP